MEGAMVGVYKCGRFKGSEDVKYYVRRKQWM